MLTILRTGSATVVYQIHPHERTSGFLTAARAAAGSFLVPHTTPIAHTMCFSYMLLYAPAACLSLDVQGHITF